MTKPNILYIHSHDTGRYLQPYGHSVPTPRLQRLAEEGVLFRQAFCAAPTCSPSRASQLTGTWAHVNGMLGLEHRGFSLHDTARTLMHELGNIGYETVLGGIHHIAEDPQAIGFSRVLDSETNDAEDLAPVVADFLRSGPREPFFLSVGFFETHRDFPRPGSEDDPRYTMPPTPLPDTPQTRQDMAAYKASARALDHGVGSVLDALESSGLSDDTLVIYTTDHGIAFPDMKCSLTDHGIGVALIMRGPGGFTGGRVCDALVSQLDLFPTICELLDIESPAWLQGTSIMPLVHGEADQVREELFAEVTYHSSYEPQRCIRTPRWKYIRRFDDRYRPVLPHCDDGPSKDVLLGHGWASQLRAEESLFDLVFDPNEANNLAGRPEFTATLSEMRAKLERWMRDTDDPILVGPVPPPPSARINHPDQTSPRDPVPETEPDWI